MKKTIVFFFLYWIPTILTAMWISFWGIYIFDSFFKNNPFELFLKKPYNIIFLISMAVMMIIIFISSKIIGIYKDTDKIANDFIRKHNEN